MRKKKPQKQNNSNALRIIGGDWRSRKLAFVDAPGMRPTPDRIRETLFDWLQGKVHGAHCLDLFAGSGALGLEALSRGANDVVFVETNKVVAAQLKANLETLKSNAKVYLSDALDFLENHTQQNQQHQQTQAYDVIFLDPPYRHDLLEKTLTLIKQQQLLKQNALIYLEHETENSSDWEGFGFKILKQAKAGQVNSLLLCEKLDSQY